MVKRIEKEEIGKLSQQFVAELQFDSENFEASEFYSSGLFKKTNPMYLI
jgi:hypothetical protein